MTKDKSMDQSIKFYFKRTYKIYPILWLLIALATVTTIYGNSNLFGALLGIIFIIILPFLNNTKFGYRALLNLPMLTYTDTTLKACKLSYSNFNSAFIMTWSDIEMINDNPSYSQIYIHLKEAGPITISTRGLNASHDEIKQAAIEFWKAAQEKA
jgi:hypothetical protein